MMQLNGDRLTMRPEGTAGCVRAVVEHNLTYNGPQRLWYSGAMFRHENVQKGRQRQFHQIGAEAFGFEWPRCRCRANCHAGSTLADFGHSRCRVANQ